MRPIGWAELWVAAFLLGIVAGMLDDRYRCERHR
jgi:hypothetical protein